MGLADRDYMRERGKGHATRTRGSMAAPWRTRSHWTKLLVFLAVMGVLFILSKYVLEERAAQPFPPTGEVRWYSHPSEKPTAPLTILAPAGTPDHVVLLDDWHSHQPVALIPVRAGETALVKVPLGRYRITMASGTRWLGAGKLFGLRGDVREAVDPLDFYATADQTMGHRIELATRLNGNMQTRPAPPF